MNTFTTAHDAKAAIIDAIEANGTDIASANEFDIDAIFDATMTFDADKQSFIQHVDVDKFWTIVMEHTR